MKEFFRKVKEAKVQQNEWNSKEIGKKYCVKSFLGSILISILLIIPIALIFIEILKIFSPVLFIYHITIILIGLTVYLFVPFTNMLYYAILKNYTEKEEIQKISLKYVFINELLNPFYLIFGILFVLALKYFIG